MLLRAPPRLERHDNGPKRQSLVRKTMGTPSLEHREIRGSQGRPYIGGTYMYEILTDILSGGRYKGSLELPRASLMTRGWWL
jgi:hypothetical protein